MKRFFKQLIVAVHFLPISYAALADIEVGSQAPNFILSDQHNVQHQLSDYEGGWVIFISIRKMTHQGVQLRHVISEML